MKSLYVCEGMSTERDIHKVKVIIKVTRYFDIDWDLSGGVVIVANAKTKLQYTFASSYDDVQAGVEAFKKAQRLKGNWGGKVIWRHEVDGDMTPEKFRSFFKTE